MGEKLSSDLVVLFKISSFYVGAEEVERRAKGKKKKSLM
jgi:hypothetical protein